VTRIVLLPAVLVDRGFSSAKAVSFRSTARGRGSDPSQVRFPTPCMPRPRSPVEAREVSYSGARNPETTSSQLSGVSAGARGRIGHAIENAYNPTSFLKGTPLLILVNMDIPASRANRHKTLLSEHIVSGEVTP
jgi:hypothetical protein